MACKRSSVRLRYSPLKKTANCGLFCLYNFCFIWRCLSENNRRMLSQSEWSLLAGWAVYFTVHSILASDKVKSWFWGKFPSSKKWYRIGYNLIATLALLPLLYFQLIQLSGFSGFLPLPIRLLALIPAISACWICKAAFRNYAITEFLGIYQQEKTPIQLTTTGINRLVRHPLYFGVVLIMVTYVVWFPGNFSVALFLLTFAYLWIGSGWEETKLIRQYGNSYLSYRSKVRRIIPFLL